MDDTLVNRVRMLTDLSFHQKAILFQLAYESPDGKEVEMGVSTLASYAGCDVGTVRRLLRHLELKNAIVRQGSTANAAIVKYNFNV